jgi:hypothetical protein
MSTLVGGAGKGKAKASAGGQSVVLLLCCNKTLK